MKNFNILSKARWLIVPILAIMCSTQMWGAETLKTTCVGTGSGYGTRRTATYDGIGWVLASGQTGYLGANSSTNHNKVKPTNDDLPVVKAQLASATTSTTGYYFYYTSTAIANVTKIEFSYTEKTGSSTVNAYVVSSSTAAASGSATWSKPTLASGTGLSAQGVNIASATGTYTFKLNAKETSSKYYGIILKTGSYSRLTAGSIKIYVDNAVAYTVNWTINPAAGGTLSTTSGTSTTVTPNSAYTYGSPAYTVTTGSATVSQSTNTFTATPSANCTIRINMVEKPKYTITYHVGSGSGVPASWTQTSYGESTTLPTATPSCDGWSFAGWCTSSAGDEDDNTTSPGTILTGSYTPTSNVDLYAVYTKTEGGGGTSDITIVPGTYTDKGTNNYGSGVERTGTVSTINLGAHYVTGNASGTPGGSSAGQFLQCQGNNANIYNKTALPGRITQVVLNQNSATAFSLYCGDEQLMSSTNTSTGQTPSGTLQTAQTAATTMTWTVSGDYTFFDIKKGSSAGYITSIVITYESGTTYYMTDYECAATPTITVSKTSIAFGDKKMGTNYQETFTVSGSDLSADINLSVGGANPTLFSIDKTSLPQDGGTVSTTTITVTWTPSASYNAATITISSTGATSKTVALSGTGKWEVIWKNDGETYETTLVASGTKPTFPSTPTSCDATSTDFVGWTNAEWSGKIDNVAGKTIHTNNTTMDNVSANGTIYYAVFAEADFEEGPDVGTTIYAENFSGFSGDSDPSGTYTNSHTGTTLYSGSVTYSKTNGSGTTQTKSESLAGGSSPELMVAKYSGTFTVAGIPRCGASELTLTYKQNGNSLTSSVSGTGYSGGKGTSTSGTTSTDIICGSGSTFTLTFTGPSGNSNVRMDDISITVKSKAGSYVQYLTNCCTSYDITKAEGGTVGGGTFSADATSACEGATVTLSTNICSGYTVGAWDVYKTGTPATKITVTSNQFTMPAYGVTVALSTTAKVDHFKDAMHETSGYTGDGYAVSGCNQTVPNLSNTTPASECEGEHYKFIGWVDDAHVDSDGTLLTGYSIVSGGTTSWNATGTTYYAIWAKEL